MTSDTRDNILNSVQEYLAGIIVEAALNKRMEKVFVGTRAMGAERGSSWGHLIQSNSTYQELVKKFKVETVDFTCSYLFYRVKKLCRCICLEVDLVESSIFLPF